jgi:hypothetical protein
VAVAQLRRAGALPGLGAGAAASTLIVVGGLVVGPQAGPHGPAATIAGYVASYGGMLALVGAWLHIGRLVGRDPALTTGAVVVVLFAWSLPLLCGPALFSRDIFSYAAHGREIALGINPYHHGPNVLGGGPYLRFVSRTWSGAPSPYGPFFLGIDALIVRHVGLHALVAVSALRLVSFAGVVLLAVWLPRLASECGADPSLALWLGVLNPLLLLHVVSGGHNDGLMLGLLIAGLTHARQDRFVSALLLCVLAATIKAPAALGVVYVGADWIRSGPNPAGRAWRTVGAAAITVSTAGVLTAAAGLGWGWLGTVTTPAQARTLLSPTTDIGLAAGRIAHHLDVTIAPGWPVSLARFVGVGVATAICIVALTDRRRPASTTGLGMSLLAVVALGPVVQPWYLLWGLVPLAAAGPGRLRSLLVWLSAGLSLLVLPNGGMAADPWVVGFLASVVVVTMVTALEPARRGGRLAAV